MPEKSRSAPSDQDLASLLVVNLVRTQHELSPYVGAESKEQKLTGAQFNALLVLRAAGSNGLPMSELGDQLVVTKSNVTGLVDRLERQGLAERQSHQDRRVTVVKLTDAGSALLEEALPERQRMLARLTGCLTPRDKQQLIQLLTKLRRGLREFASRQRAFDDTTPASSPSALRRVRGRAAMRSARQP